MRTITAIVLLTVALAGCITSDDSNTPTGGATLPIADETTTYSVESDGESVGVVDVHYRVEASQILAWVNGSVGGNAIEIAYVIDAKTLARIQIVEASNTRFSWGDGRWGPHSHSFLAGNINHPDLLLPIGIQRLATPTMNGWQAEDDVPCAQSCAILVDGSPAAIHVRASSHTNSFLPMTYQTQIVGFDAETSINVTLTAQTPPRTGSAPARFENAPPSNLVDSPACGLASCEPMDWPLHMSFQAALDAASMRPEWLLNSQGDGQPLEMAVFSPQFLESDALVGSNDIIWVMGLLNPDGTSTYTLRAPGTGDGGYGPVVVETATQRPANDGEARPRNWPASLIRLDPAIDDWLGQTGGSFDSVVSLQFVAWPSDFNIDPRGQVELFITLGPANDRTYVVNSLTNRQLRGYGDEPSSRSA